MTTIEVRVRDQAVSIAATPVVASGDQKSVKLRVRFSHEWDDYTRSAVFFTGVDETVYEVMLTDNQCDVPHEVLAKMGSLYFGFRGVDPTDQRIKTSEVAKYSIRRGAPPGTATTQEPTPDVYQQILARLNEIETGGGTGGGGVDFVTDKTLTLKNGVLSVNTAKVVEKDNTLPVTSAAVHTVVGNIEVLLSTI